jgi:3-phosphoshikimate 1-carboxyvinyltransferase
MSRGEKEIEITPITYPLDATIRVPGSKSITNRVLLIAAMAAGRSTLEGVLLADDTRYMIEALRALGFALEVREQELAIAIEGRGGEVPAAAADLFVGGAGTAMRFLTGFLTLARGKFRIDGNRRMRQRPIGAMIDALASLGIRAVSEYSNGCPPLIIEPIGRDFRGGACRLDARQSSQFASGLLLPAPLWADGLELTMLGAVAWPFVDMTLRLMRRWGARAQGAGDVIRVPGGQRYTAGQFAVEPDASSLSYFAAAAALCAGKVRLPGVARDSVQGDLAFLEVLERMGAVVLREEEGVEVRGSGCLSGVDMDMSAMPDMVPTLAVMAPFASSPTLIRNVGFIRHHESDRLQALARELTRLGVQVKELDDGLYILPSKLRPATVETYDDHRIAMSFAVAGLKLGGLKIKNPDCVAKTYPAFFSDLASLA